MEYRYPRFQREVLVADMAFQGGPRPGEPFPDFELVTTSGSLFEKSDFLGKPLLLTLGSFTCPMTASAGPALRGLYREFGRHVAFLTVYVREAHPGERYPQPETFEEKVRHARDYKERDDIPWPVAVDDLSGTLHQALDGKPCAAYLLDNRGKVAFRVLWSNEESALRDALGAVLAGRKPLSPESGRLVVPMLRGLGEMYDVMGLAGRQACEDFRHEAPTLYGLARMASAFRMLPPFARGIAGMVTTLGAILLVMGLGWSVARVLRAGPARR